MTVIFASAAVAAAFALLVYTLFSRRKVANVLQTADGVSRVAVADVRELQLSQGAGRRLVGPAFSRFGEWAQRISPQGRVESLHRQLVLAGLAQRYPVEQILILKFVLGGAATAAWLFTPFRTIPFAILVGPLTILIFFFLPEYFILRTARDRQLRIQRELADTLDQVTMSVEAGLGFEGALERVAQSGSGPFNDELKRMLLEMQLGASRSDALRNLADRTDVPDLKSFVFAIVQSEAYGLPIAQVLRVQAAELRDKRRQRAEERAFKIPVLLIMPLAFGIFPALFIVLLGPAAIRIFRDLAPAINP